MARLKEIYRKEIAPKLKEELKLANVMEVPRITKITLNMGLGEAIGDKKVIENAVADLEITTTATSGSAAGRVPTPLGGPLPAPMVELDSDFVSDTACSRFSSHGDT